MTLVLFVVFMFALSCGFGGGELAKRFPSVWPSTSFYGPSVRVFIAMRVCRLVATVSYYGLVARTRPAPHLGLFGVTALLVFGWVGVLALHDLNEVRLRFAEIAERTRVRDAAARQGK
jgi:hypothetical protein